MRAHSSPLRSPATKAGKTAFGERWAASPRRAATEPGHEGREDVDDVRVPRPRGDVPLRSPATKAGKTAAAGGGRERRRAGRYGARPRRPGRLAFRSVGVAAVWPLRSPATKTGKTRASSAVPRCWVTPLRSPATKAGKTAAPGSGRGRAIMAATEPGHEGREDGVVDRRAGAERVAATEPGHEGREDGGKPAGPRRGRCRYGARPRRPGRPRPRGRAASERREAATEPGHEGREDPDASRQVDVCLRAATEPGHEGREDRRRSVGPGTTQSCRYGARPRRPGRPGRVCAGDPRRCRAATEPGHEGREDMASIGPDSADLRPAATEPGHEGREDQQLAGTSSGPAAATEPGHEGREDATARAHVQCGGRRYGARPRRPGRRLAQTTRLDQQKLGTSRAVSGAGLVARHSSGTSRSGTASDLGASAIRESARHWSARIRGSSPR